MGALSALQRTVLKPDARWWQIGFLASFLLFGALWHDIAIAPAQVLLCALSALGTQAAWQWGLRLPTRRRWSGYLSAAVSTLGICILVRSNGLWVHPLLAAVAMSSKYLLRAGPEACRSHVLNPANLAAFLAWALLPDAWLSPGQWGSGSLLALWFMALGLWVTRRAQRVDVSLAFLLAWGGLCAARLAGLGYAWDPGVAMWLRQVGNGAVLLFAFFMISDPMTTPQRRVPRLVYALLVALAAFVWQYQLFRPHGLIVTLFAASWLVPWINHAWPAPRASWAREPVLTFKPESA
ncbi:RnfABCDGE type electron transport complex subunit D [Inhella inkyongensis]|uniref:RnfABCDGE type electron transport complex subunit D n=1 Tax=Inhella inkyongensis TaxID=392593 RepID=UPI00110E96F7|nr:RnfABCDGE type electron transport complex subunit D [Inhella inkyongensis]